MRILSLDHQTRMVRTFCAAQPLREHLKLKVLNSYNYRGESSTKNPLAHTRLNTFFATKALSQAPGMRPGSTSKYAPTAVFLQNRFLSTQVENYPQGYPRYSAFIAADGAFNIYRRFSVVRSRLLLLKQDKISQLEEQLQEIDENESAPLFLGYSRRDRNDERNRVLQELEVTLAEYGVLLGHNLMLKLQN
jgi:hypothetical protein